MRLLRAIAESGSFTAAAVALGYTQSAVSRQMAVLERAADARLFERQAGGVRLTAAGLTLLRHASAALDEVDRAAQVLQGADPDGGTARLGIFTSAGAVLVPEALGLMRRRRSDVQVVTREGSTPALVRSLRASTLDLAVISARPPYPAPDDQDPPLELDVLLEGDLLVAVPALGDLGRDGSVSLADLQDATWISNPQTPNDPGLGVWPALPRRPTIGHRAPGSRLADQARPGRRRVGHHHAPVLPRRARAGRGTARPRPGRRARVPPRAARTASGDGHAGRRGVRRLLAGSRDSPAAVMTGLTRPRRSGPSVVRCPRAQPLVGTLSAAIRSSKPVAGSSRRPSAHQFAEADSTTLM